jgi:hypothetical protein
MVIVQELTKNDEIKLPGSITWIKATTPLKTENSAQSNPLESTNQSKPQYPSGRNTDSVVKFVLLYVI